MGKQPKNFAPVQMKNKAVGYMSAFNLNATEPKIKTEKLDEVTVTAPNLTRYERAKRIADRESQGGYDTNWSSMGSSGGGGRTSTTRNYNPFSYAYHFAKNMLFDPRKK